MSHLSYKYLAVKTQIFNLIIGKPLFFPFCIEYFNKQKVNKDFDLSLYNYKEYTFLKSNLLYYKPTYQKNKNFIFNLISSKHLYKKKNFTYNYIYELNFFKLLFTLPYTPKLNQYNSTLHLYTITLPAIKRILKKYTTRFLYLPIFKFNFFLYNLLKLRKY